MLDVSACARLSLFPQRHVSAARSFFFGGGEPSRRPQCARALPHDAPSSPLPSYPYAAALALGGIAAFTGPAHSVASLQASAVAAGALGLAATASLSAYDKGRKATWAIALSLAVSLAVAGGMGARYRATGKAWPGLYVAAPSAVMAVFYLWCLVAGPTPAGKKEGVAARTRSSSKKKTQ